MKEYDLIRDLQIDIDKGIKFIEPVMLTISSKGILTRSNIGPVFEHTHQHLTVVLMRNKLKPAELQILVNAIALRKEPTSLVLCYNEIDAEGATVIASLFTRTPHIAKLDLAGNNLGNEGAVIIASAIMRAQRQSQPLELNFRMNNIGFEGVDALAGVVRTIQCAISVNLDFNAITDLGARALARAANLSNQNVTLSLQATHHCSEDIASAFAEPLAQKKEEFSVNLSNNSLNENSVLIIAQSLWHATHPRAVSIKASEIKNDAIMAFSAAFFCRRTQLTLDLGNNLIRRQTYLPLARSLERTRHPINLSLANCDIYSQEAREILLSLMCATVPIILNLSTNNLRTEVLNKEGKVVANLSDMFASFVRGAWYPVKLLLSNNCFLSPEVFFKKLEPGNFPRGTEILGLGTELENLCKKNDAMHRRRDLRSARLLTHSLQGKYGHAIFASFFTQQIKAPVKENEQAPYSFDLLQRRY